MRSERYDGVRPNRRNRDLIGSCRNAVPLGGNALQPVAARETPSTVIRLDTPVFNAVLLVEFPPMYDQRCRQNELEPKLELQKRIARTF